MKKVIVLLLVLMVASVWANNLLVVNTGSEVLSNIDLDEETVDVSYTVLGQDADCAPNTVVVYDGFAYVTITYENSVQKIDLETGDVVSYIYLEDSAAPNDICIYNGFAYVTGHGTYKLYQIDLSDDSVVGNIEVGKSPEGVWQADGKIWVANTGYDFATWSYDPGTVSVVDPENFEVIATVGTGLNPRNGIIVNGKVHVACTGDYGDISGNVDVIDPQTYQVETTVETGGTPAVLENAAGNVYVGHSWPAGISVYDEETQAIGITLEDSIFVGGNSLDKDDEYLYVADAGNYKDPSTVRVYSLADHQLVNEYVVAVGAVDITYYGASVAVNEEQVVAAGITCKNYPNPFNPETTISFILNTENTENTEIAVYNVKGQRVKTLVNEKLAAGNHSVVWNGRDENNQPVASGIYFYRIKSGKASQTNKMILMK